MKTLLKIMLALLNLILIVGIAAAQGNQNNTEENTQVELKVGDKAPSLKIAKWVKGEPVTIDSLKGKGIVVVEFWATWCPPCRASIPHLTEIQKKYKEQNVVIIGISNEDVQVVEEFVEKAGEKMDYRVAVDDNDVTTERYMVASGARGIPHAFIIDKEGRIAWAGHPLSKDFEKALEKLVAPSEKGTSEPQS